MKNVGKLLTEFRSGTKWSVWKRKYGSNRVNVYITYGDASDMLKLLEKHGIKDIPNDGRGHIDSEYVQQNIRKYVIENKIFKSEYGIEGFTEREYCPCCKQEI